MGIEALPAGLEILLLNAAWPVLMAYAGFRVVLAFRRYEDRPRTAEALSSGLGGVVCWWGRVVYGFDIPLDWPFTLTVLGAALMVGPKLWGIAMREHV